MKIDKILLNTMIEKAKQNGESINYNNFSLYSCEIVVDRFIDSLIEMECNIEDIYMICNMISNKLLKHPIKKNEEKSDELTSDRRDTNDWTFGQDGGEEVETHYSGKITTFSTKSL